MMRYVMKMWIMMMVMIVVVVTHVIIKSDGDVEDGQRAPMHDNVATTECAQVMMVMRSFVMIARRLDDDGMVNISSTSCTMIVG